MNQAAEAITKLYSMTGSEFDRRIAIMETNIKARLLEDFVVAPEGIHTSIDELLGDLSACVIQVQKTACRESKITDEEKLDFECRIDNCLADAINAIRQGFTRFGNRNGVEFQLETARKLGIPDQ